MASKKLSNRKACSQNQKNFPSGIFVFKHVDVQMLCSFESFCLRTMSIVKKVSALCSRTKLFRMRRRRPRQFRRETWQSMKKQWMPISPRPAGKFGPFNKMQQDERWMPISRNNVCASNVLAQCVAQYAVSKFDFRQITLGYIKTNFGNYALMSEELL